MSRFKSVHGKVVCVKKRDWIQYVLKASQEEMCSQTGNLPDVWLLKTFNCV